METKGCTSALRELVPGVGAGGGVGWCAFGGGDAFRISFNSYMAVMAASTHSTAPVSNEATYVCGHAPKNREVNIVTTIAAALV